MNIYSPMSNPSPFTTAVIVSTYNRPGALKVVLESLLNQTLMPDQIIVADDGSTAETYLLVESFISRYPSLITHVWHEDTGFRLAAIRNKAMAQALADYLIQIDGDIMLHPKFVADHTAMAKRGYFVAGSRAMLTKTLTDRIITAGYPPKLNPFDKGIHNRLNALRIPFLMKLMALEQLSSRSYKKIKGCHMAFWKDDFLFINGYNEDFEGWGSEDVEIELRFFNAGLKRCNLKFGALQYHLYHPDNSKARERINESLVLETKTQNLIRCNNGIQKYME